MLKTIFIALLISSPFYAIEAQSNLARGEFLYNKIKIHVGADNIDKIQAQFENKFAINHDSNLPNNLIGYVNIKEPGIAVNEMVATPSFYFDFKKSNNALQKTTLIFFIDNAHTESDFKLAIKKITVHLPLLNLYANKNRQVTYDHGLKIEFKKKKADEDGYQIEIDIQRQLEPTQ